MAVLRPESGFIYLQLENVRLENSRLAGGRCGICHRKLIVCSLKNGAQIFNSDHFLSHKKTIRFFFFIENLIDNALNSPKCNKYVGIKNQLLLLFLLFFLFLLFLLFVLFLDFLLPERSSGVSPVIFLALQGALKIIMRN